MHCDLEATGGTMGRAKTTLIPFNPWAARYITELLVKLTLKGVVFFFLFFSHVQREEASINVWHAVCM